MDLQQLAVFPGAGGQPGLATVNNVPAPSGVQRGRGPGRGNRGRQARKPKRAKIPAVTGTSNPMAADFSFLSVAEGIEQVDKWMDRLDEVRRRRQFQVTLVETVMKAEDGEPQILNIAFCGGFVVGGTFPMIMRALYARIIKEVERSFEQAFAENHFVILD